MPTSSTRRLPLRVLVLALGMVAALGGAPSWAQEVVHVGGTGAGTLILQRLIEMYSKSHPESRVEAILPPLGSSGGMNALDKGGIQIAIVSRLPPPEKAGEWGVVSWLKTPVVLVARDVPDGTGVSQAQIADIYAGRLTQWPGGGPIRLVMRADGDADTMLLRSLSPALDAAVRAAWKRPGLPIVENDVDNQQLLEKTPGAFGIMSLAQALLLNATLKPLALDGVMPSVATLLDGTYPHMRKFYLLTGKNPSAEVRAFLAYVQSPETMKQLVRYGLAPLAP
ncbi:MAG: substrate-binding domain-containing protein [Alphaproteobacteria bacterium]|nr:substrate-binding domain-containing protein [Alphaproteobacteria bacterium]